MFVLFIEIAEKLAFWVGLVSQFDILEFLHC